MTRPERQHGKYSTYIKGCRCQNCTTANRDYQRDRATIRKNNQPITSRDAYQPAEYIEGDTSWHTQAACKNVDTNLFFPAGGSGTPTNWDQAVTICQQCPVVNQCLEFALRTQQKDGVWGATTPHQRQQMRRQGNQLPCPSCDNTYPAGTNRWRCHNCTEQARKQYQQAHRRYQYLNTGT